MTITRRGLFDEIDRLDKQIANLQDAKSECLESYRDQMKAEGRKKSDVADEIIACKKAFRRHRALDKNADAVLSQDALVDEIVAELQKPAGTRNANAPAPASRVAPPAEPAPRPEPKPEPDEDFNDIPPHLKRPFPGEARAT